MSKQSTNPEQAKFGTRVITSFFVLLIGVITILFLFGKSGQAAMATMQNSERPESTRASPIILNPANGKTIGATYQAFLSPHQEGGEEEDTPATVPAEFRSTAPSVARNKRPDRGHAVIEFSQDLSKAYVHLSIENVKVEDINMLHLHCGRPGQLGPILIDFSMIGNLQKYFANNTLNIEISNEDIVAVTNHSQGITGFITAGCPIIPTIPLDRIKTIAGMELVARQGELYFNLHTKGQTYFGDIRGQFEAVSPSK
jgi:hypothetical protein